MDMYSLVAGVFFGWAMAALLILDVWIAVWTPEQLREAATKLNKAADTKEKSTTR